MENKDINVNSNSINNDRVVNLPRDNTKPVQKEKKKNDKPWQIILSGLALGFFVSLILGTVLEEIGKINGTWSDELVLAGGKLKTLMPVIVGASIAHKLKLDFIKSMGMIISVSIGGGFGEGFGDLIASFVTALVTYYIFKAFLWKEIKIDTILIPMIAAIIGILMYLSVYEVSSTINEFLGKGIESFTSWNKWLMGPIVGLSLGIILTTPFSSAALAFAINIGGDNGSLAAGAAMAGTSAQMISFGILTLIATKSFSKSGIVAFGSSMMQFTNVLRNRKIIYIPAIASAVSGFIAVMFDIVSPTAAAGMGTSSLIGPLLSINSSTILDVTIVTLLVPIAITIPLYFVFSITGKFKAKDFMFDDE